MGPEDEIEGDEQRDSEDGELLQEVEEEERELADQIEEEVNGDGE